MTKVKHCFLCFYVFMFVFSLSMPIFYHSAFFVGVITSVHLLYVKKALSLSINNYIGKFVVLSLIGYLSVIIIVMAHDTYDLTYLKTYTNNILSSLCAIPLAYLFVHYYKHDAFNKISQIFGAVFFIQAVIIVLTFLSPELKSIVVLFHRDAEATAAADVFSKGLRSNALSGGLFFGLALSFSLGLLIYLFNAYILNRNKFTAKGGLYYFIINIGLAFSGRFGAIYVLILPILFIKLKSKTKQILRAFFYLIILMLLAYIIYLNNNTLKNLYDTIIYGYVFEMLDAYLTGGGGGTYSTNRLIDMYNLNVPVESLIFGDGLYTGADGLYYKHVDVGYLRILLFGGIPFLIFGLVFTFSLISPLFNITVKGQTLKPLFFSILALYLLASFKGEVMVTLVSVNSLVFLLCLVLILTNRILRRKI